MKYKQNLLERMKTYSKSDYRIKCNFLKPEEIASRILNCMKVQEIKTKNLENNYSILIGENILKILPKIKFLCPKTKRIVIIIDKNIPKNLRIF